MRQKKGHLKARGIPRRTKCVLCPHNRYLSSESRLMYVSSVRVINESSFVQGLKFH